MWIDDASGWTTAAVLLVAGIVAGVVAEVALSRLTRRWARREGKPNVAAFARAVRWLPMTLGLLAGVGLAAVVADLPADVTQVVDTVVTVGAVLAATFASARLAGEAVRQWMALPGADLPSSSIFANVARSVVLAVGILVALSATGVSITPILTALGVGGLAVSLALQDTLGNLFAGIQVLLSGQIEPGDLIELESGEVGHVHDVTWRNTTVRLFSNDLVVVPNAKLASSIVRNYTSLDPEHVVWVESGVAYGSDLERVEEVTLQVAREVLRDVPGGVAGYEPLVRFHTFRDSAVGLRVSLRAAGYEDRWRLSHELVKRLHRRYGEEGIEIPFPQRDVRVKRD